MNFLDLLKFHMYSYGILVIPTTILNSQPRVFMYGLWRLSRVEVCCLLQIILSRRLQFRYLHVLKFIQIIEIWHINNS